MLMQDEGLGRAHEADGGALPATVRLCDDILLAWIRSRPNKLWKLDFLVSQLSFLFFLPILGEVREARPSQRGPAYCRAIVTQA